MYKLAKKPIRKGSDIVVYHSPGGDEYPQTPFECIRGRDIVLISEIGLDNSEQRARHTS
jgi:hypothetical protein